MAKDIPCDSCGKPATVHLTQILQGKVHKVDLCEECAGKLGVTDPSGFSVADLLAQQLAPPSDADSSAADSSAALACPACGLTRAQFKKSGRFGCPSCYEAFASLLSSLLRGMHHGLEHHGKVPHRALRRRQSANTLAALEKSLRAAIAAEDFESAAGLRDQISRLKSEAVSSDEGL